MKILMLVGVLSTLGAGLVAASMPAGADVDEEVRNTRDAARPAVLRLENTGPLLYTSLPPGRYEVKVQAAGRQQVKPVALPERGARELVFYWDE